LGSIRRFGRLLFVAVAACAAVSCSPFTKQAEQKPPPCAIRGCQWTSASTISPELASIAEAYTLFCYGELFGIRGEFPKALEEFQKASQRLPDCGYLDLQQARVLVEQDKLKEALAKLDLAIEKSPELAEAYYLRGGVHKVLMQVSEAIADYTKAAELGYDEANVRFTISELYMVQKEYAAAIKQLRMLKRLEPATLRTNFSLGRLLLLVGRPKEAIPYLTAASSIQPSNVGISRLLLEAYSQAGTLDKAVSLAKQMVQQSPRNARLRFLLGSLLDRTGKTDEAIRQLKLAIELQPGFAAALNYLGYLYITTGTRISEGISLVKAALAIEPHNSAFLDSLGWGFFKLGQLQQAIKYLKEALAGLKDAASEPVICAHMAAAYRKVGNIKEARRYLALAASAKSDDPELRSLLEELGYPVGPLQQEQPETDLRREQLP